MLIKIEFCPICLSSKHAFFKKGHLTPETLSPEKIKITDAEYGLTWDLSRCLDCGYIFANPCPETGVLTSFYSQVKDPSYEAEAVGRRQNFRRIIKQLEKFLPQKGHLFDVGAATGLLLVEARERGWQVSGLEPSGWAVEIANKKYGLKLSLGSLEDFRANEVSYDAVTLIDILEHTPDPRLILKKARQLLKPGGIMVIVTPDIESLAAKLAGNRWWHFRPAHLGYFNRSSLEKLLSLMDFTVLSWRRYHWSFSLNYLLSRRPSFSGLLRLPFLAFLWPRIRLKLVLGDSFEVYIQKKETI